MADIASRGRSGKTVTSRKPVLASRNRDHLPRIDTHNERRLYRSWGAVTPGGKTIRSRRTAIAVLLCLLLDGLLTPALAAGVFVVEGRVTDMGGTPIAGATVQSVNGAAAPATTDAQGHYRLEYLTNDYDELRASKSGFQSDYAIVNLLTQRDPVDFALNLSLNVDLTPRYVRPTASTPITISASSRLDWVPCVRAELPDSRIVSLEYAGENNSVKTWRATFTLPQGLADGGHRIEVTASRCENNNVTLGGSSGYLIVDGTAPVLDQPYPEAGATVPSGSVIPSYRYADATSGVATHNLSVTELETSETTQLSVSPSYTGRATGSIFPTIEGHHYRLRAEAIDRAGNASILEWSIIAGEPPVGRTITQTAPFEFGDQCTLYGGGAVLQVTSGGCGTDPAALTKGDLKIAFAGSFVDDGWLAMGAAGISGSGAGLLYSPPGIRNVEVTAETTGVTGAGLVCILIQRGTYSMGGGCAPAGASTFSYQFQTSSMETLRVGGWLLPVCLSQGLASECGGAATAKLSKVTLVERG